MSHPIQFVDYACGHSTPVPGAGGGVVNRPCQSCATGQPSPRVRTNLTVSLIMGYTVRKESPKP
jgi:hypothetical protein